MSEPTDIERGLQRLESELKRLEVEYNQYFAGRLPKPPWETRSRVESLIKSYDRIHIQNYGDRFRFLTLQSRYSTFTNLWDRSMRAREEGRPGPFSHKHAKAAVPKSGEARILHDSSFRDPIREQDKLCDLYESVVKALDEVGQGPVPFHKFAALVRQQVKTLRDAGSPEVAFRVAVKDGKLNFTARALKGAKG